MKLSGNHHSIIRQRLGSGTVSSLSTYWAGLKVYAEFERVVTGAEDFGTFVNKMYEAYDRYVKNAIYDAMINYSEGAEVGQFKKTGTPVAADLNALCDLVSTATGNPVIIMGTRTALSKVTALQNATYISEDMKNEHYRNGVLGYWEGKELVEIPQVFEKGKVGAYKIKNDLLWIMPVSDIKFIKLVNEGEVQLHSVMDKGTNMDMTYEQEMQVKLGVGILLNSAFGVYDMEV